MLLSISAMVVALGVAAPIVLLAPLGRSHGPGFLTSTGSGSPVQTAAHLEHGRFVCTVSFPSATIYPGQETGASADLRNISGGVASAANRPVSLLIRDESGNVVADTSRPLGASVGGIVGPYDIPAAGSVPVGVADIHVIWPGTISVIPVCESVRLPPVTLQVSNPGKSPPDDESVREAATAAGAPFAGCAPTGINQWVTGVVHRATPPSDQSFPARCGGLVLENPGFDTVVLAMVSPPGAPSVNLAALAEHPDLGAYAFHAPKAESIAVSWWVYVVTRDRITLVGQHTVSQNCEGIGGYQGEGISSCRFPTRSHSIP